MLVVVKVPDVVPVFINWGCGRKDWGVVVIGCWIVPVLLAASAFSSAIGKKKDLLSGA